MPTPYRTLRVPDSTKIVTILRVVFASASFADVPLVKSDRYDLSPTLDAARVSLSVTNLGIELLYLAIPSTQGFIDAGKRIFCSL